MDSLWALQRSRTDSRVAGLCGALAQRWSIDPLLVRIIAALLGLSAGIGVVLYLAGWLILPREGHPEPPAYRLFPASRNWSHQVWTTIVVAAVVVSVWALGQHVTIGMAPAAIVLGVVVWNRRRAAAGQPGGRPRTRPPGSPAPPTRSVGSPGPPDTPFTATAREWQQRVWQARQEPGSPKPYPPGSYSPDSYPPDSYSPAQSPAPPASTTAVKAFLTTPDPAGLYRPQPPRPVATAVAPSRRGPRSLLVVVLVVGLVLAGLALVDQVGPNVPAEVFWGAAMLTSGVGCLVSGLLGRSRLLAGLTALLVITGLLASVPQRVSQDWSQGSQSSRQYLALADVPAETRLDFGTLTLDLSRVEITENRTVAAHVDAGKVVVIAPTEGRVVVDARSDWGSVEVFGQTATGGEAEMGRTDGQGRHTLTLNLTADYGEVQVRR